MPQQSIFVVYAYPLDASRRKLATKRGEPYPAMEEVRSTADAWSGVWKKVNEDDRLINKLGELTSITLPHVIEANIIGGLFVPMSVPFIIPITDHTGAKLSDDDFLHHCCHELTHRFIIPRKDIPGIDEYWNAIRARYAQESIDTQNHILVYALLKLLLPTQVSKSVWAACQKIHLPDYKRAFDLMETRGAEDCLAEFRSYTAHL